MASIYLWPQYPFLSLMAFLAITMTFLYLAREPVRRALSSLKEGSAGGFRQIADWTQGVADRLREKNRKVLFESGIVQAEQRITHEFGRLESSYTKRLAAYPELHRELAENVAKIDTDYKESGSVAPEAPGWGDVVESLVRVQESTSDRAMKSMLGEIRKSAIDGEKKALQEFRADAAKRHKVLGGMAATWQKIEKLMKQVSTVVSSTLETTAKIDHYMEEYEDLRSQGEESADLLSARATKLFLFSLIVILVAGGGAFINFQLIALPMSELVPAGARIVGMPVARLAALVIVTLEVVAGIFLLESLGITNIFPQIGSLTSNRRRAITYAAFAGLFFLASVEASLAILREQLVEAEISLREALAGGTSSVAEAEQSMIPVIGQATLGFVLPWILAMVAIPLETLIESSQHVLIKLVVALVFVFGYLARIIAYLLEQILTLVSHLFDAYIAVPAVIGESIKNRGRGDD